MIPWLHGAPGKEVEVGVRKMVWVLVLAAVTPLLAGGAEALGQPDSEYPPPKDYAYRNGKVFIEGDVVVPCELASEYGPTEHF
jgi:hypothetical protein